MAENNTPTIPEYISKDTYEKYNLLINCLIWEYDKEISRKGRLEAKTTGYFSLLGIFFAAFLVIEPKLIERIIDVCLCLHNFNNLLVVLYFAFFIITFILLKDAYKPKARKEIKISKVWNELLECPYENICESIKEQLSHLNESFYQQNEKLAKKLDIVNICIMIQGAIITVLFIAFFVISI